MLRTRMTLTLLALHTSGCDWFGKEDSCEEGAERCNGRTIQTCVPSVSAGEVQPTMRWKKTASCALVGEGLTCRAEDGLAECVRPPPDAGFADSAQLPPDAAVPTSTAPSWKDISPVAPRSAERWTLLSVRRVGAELVLTRTKEAVLDFAPPSAATGTAAVVSYGLDGAPRSASFIALPADGETTAWVTAEQATRVRVLRPGGMPAGELELGEARGVVPTQSGLLGLQQSALETALPPTMTLLEEGELILRHPADGGPISAVRAPEKLLRFATAALRRLSPFAVSMVPRLAFAAIPERTQLIGGTLVIRVGDATFSSILEDPYGFELELARRVGLQFVAMTSPEALKAIGLQTTEPFVFAQDFPPDVAALIRQRVSPLLTPRETFQEAWGSLHGLAVEAKLASPYLMAGTDDLDARKAVQAGFASRWGASGAAQDFADYLAHASVPEAWRESPCTAIRSAPIDQLAPTTLVHLAKLEALWGLGLLSSAQLESCTGQLGIEAGAQGIVATKPDGMRVSFLEGVSGRRDQYYHGQDQVALSAYMSKPADIAASFMVSVHGVPSGLFRLTSVSHRDNPEVGASFFLDEPLTYTRGEATAGLLLITRLDEERIEAHALMVRQGGKKPFFDAQVFPLITARYDIPADERGELVEDEGTP